MFFRTISFIAKRLVHDDERYVCFFCSYFGGNIKPVMAYMQKNMDNFIPYYMSENKNQIEIAKKQGFTAYWHHDVSVIPFLTKTTIFVTTHGESLPISRRAKIKDYIKDMLSQADSKYGSNTFPPSYGPSISKRVELWHGVGFKDVLAEEYLNFGTLVPPDILCVTSDFIKDWYIDRVGFNNDIFRITGFPRNDIFFKKVDKNKTLAKIDLPKNRKTILYAPTWEQEFNAKKTKNIFFWEPNDVLDSLHKTAEKMNVNIIVRTHGLWQGKMTHVFNSPYVKYVPMHEFPDASELLAISDVLISDWSSITVDYLFTKKPTIYIDKPDPFHGNFCLSPSDRAGTLVKTLDELINAIEKAIDNPEKFVNKTMVDTVLKKSFKYFDDKATERVAHEISILRNPNE